MMFEILFKNALALCVGGTDVMDQRIGSLSCKSMSKRWTWVVLCYILDTIRVNAQTIYALNKGIDPKKLDSFEFLMDLARDLVLPQMKNKPLDGLQSIILKKRAIFWGLTMPNEIAAEALPSRTGHPKVAEKQWFCHVCYSQLPHTDKGVSLLEIYNVLLL